MTSGNGTEYDEKGQIIYKGSWLQGQREGQGIEYDHKSKKPGLFYYKGHWKNGLKDGLGRHVIGSEANYYEGHYLNGLRHGNGTLVFPELNYTYVGRVIYDWVWNRKNYFEIPAFLPIEQGISRAGKFKEILPTLRSNYEFPAIEVLHLKFK